MQNEKMHILFICSWYPNRKFPALGNFIRDHAHALSTTHRVSVLYACADEKLEEGRSEIVKNKKDNLLELVSYYGKTKISAPVFSQLAKKKNYMRAMENIFQMAITEHGSPSVIHAQVIWPAAIAVLPLLKKYPVPLVITEHWSGYLPEDGNYKGAILKYYSRKMVEKARAVTVVSDRMKQAMHKHGLTNNFILLPNCSDERIFHTAENKVKKNGFHLLHVSMLVDREKNISGILNVMEKLKIQDGITLDIIGEGPERNKFEAMVHEKGLEENVFFKGFGTPEQIASAMRNADALLLFSNFEGMPVTIIEALLSGIPVIATRTGHIPQMIDASNGILVETGNETELINAILDLQKSIDKFDAVAISRNAKEKYSYAAAEKILSGIYDSLKKE
ncbi:MAG: glycosyltransferase [Bacteroidetes bacterium]|nr:glycosyltransferase [Bacteroidota bacterium]